MTLFCCHEIVKRCEISFRWLPGHFIQTQPDYPFKYEAQTALFKDPVRTAQ